MCAYYFPTSTCRNGVNTSSVPTARLTTNTQNHGTILPSCLRQNAQAMPQAAIPTRYPNTTLPDQGPTGFESVRNFFMPGEISARRLNTPIITSATEAPINTAIVFPRGI